MFDAASFATLPSRKEGLHQCYELTGWVKGIGAKPVGLAYQDFKSAAKSIYDGEGYRLPTDPSGSTRRAGTRAAFYSGGIVTRVESGVCVEEPALNGAAWYYCNAGKSTKPATPSPLRVCLTFTQRRYAEVELEARARHRINHVPPSAPYGSLKTAVSRQAIDTDMDRFSVR